MVERPSALVKLSRRTPISTPIMVPPTMARPKTQSMFPSCRCLMVAITDFPQMCVTSIPEAIYPGNPKTMRAGVTI